MAARAISRRQQTAARPTRAASAAATSTDRGPEGPTRSSYGPAEERLQSMMSERAPTPPEHTKHSQSGVRADDTAARKQQRRLPRTAASACTRAPLIDTTSQAAR